ISDGGCFGSNGNNNDPYSYIKGGVGFGRNFSSATGYSKTFKILPINNQESEKQTIGSINAKFTFICIFYTLSIQPFLFLFYNKTKQRCGIN
ncbi:hypothetical protein, partial [Moraxella marmotae]|uniref:hypothetical protein n=1 Tax=Moraxella marmotae TaxID=3344520 RepID=UPI0035F3A8DC